MSDLRECFDRHGCDKGSRHGYERVYEPIFEPLRDEPIRILEIGILRGESLAAWVDYFSKAEIVAIDTFRRVPVKDVPILSHPRITWRTHDSRKPINLGHFDFVIDDGLHQYPHQRKTFEVFMPQSEKYFIEDMWSWDHLTKEDHKHPWYTEKRRYTAVEYEKLMNVLAPYDVKYHDLREGYQRDSFIYEVT